MVREIARCDSVQSVKNTKAKTRMRVFLEIKTEKILNF